MELIKKRPLKYYVLYTVIIVLGIILDQVTKAAVAANMALHESIPIIDGIIHITYVQNKGAAFGMMADQRWLFIVVSTLAIIGFSLYLYLGHAQNTLYAVAIAMVISGGIGNMIDRIGLGYVVDFIHCKFVKYPVFSDGGMRWQEFPVFNGADSFVCVGAGLLVLALILEIVAEAKAKKVAESVKSADESDDDRDKAV